MDDCLRLWMFLLARDPLINSMVTLAFSQVHSQGAASPACVGLSRSRNAESGLGWKPPPGRGLALPVAALSRLPRVLAIAGARRLAQEAPDSRRAAIELIRGSLSGQVKSTVVYSGKCSCHLSLALMSYFFGKISQFVGPAANIGSIAGIECTGRTFSYHPNWSYNPHASGGH